MDRDYLHRIYIDIIHLINKHMNTSGGVVCDIGESSSKYRYVFVDIGLGLGKNKEIDNAKIIFMNDVMELLIKFQSMIGEWGPYETIDEHIDCSEFICQPCCKCKNKEIDYQKFDLITNNSFE